MAKFTKEVLTLKKKKKYVYANPDSMDSIYVCINPCMCIYMHL